MSISDNPHRWRWHVRHGRSLSERREPIRRPKVSTPRKSKDWR